MVVVAFKCGHTKYADGSEDKLVCACGEIDVDHVDAPLPRFQGTVTGPHAEFKDLPAKAVTFRESTNG